MKTFTTKAFIAIEKDFTCHSTYNHFDVCLETTSWLFRYLTVQLFKNWWFWQVITSQIEIKLLELEAQASYRFLHCWFLISELLKTIIPIKSLSLKQREMDKLLPNNWPLLFRAVCHVQKMDIWFLIDESGSIGRRNFETSLQFVADLSAQFSISLNGVRAGFSVYSSSHTFYSRFNEHTSNSDFSQLVLSTPYNNGEWILLWKIFHSFNWIDAPVVLPYVKNCNRCSLGAIFQYLTGGTRTGAAIDECYKWVQKMFRTSTTFRRSISRFDCFDWWTKFR